MPNFVKNSYKPDNTTETALGLLRELESGDTLSQRSIASRLGVALGLTNALIKRAVNKGLVKVSEAPARRFAYYLTPQGFSEKARLVSEYLSVSLNFFRHVRSQYELAIEECHKKGWNRVALVGTGELAEIAVLSAMDSDVQLLGVIDSERNEPTFRGLKVVGSFDFCAEVDAVIITDEGNPQQTYDRIVKIIDDSRILTPDILHVTRTPTVIKRGGDK